MAKQKDIKSFILSKVPEAYTRIHSILEILEVLDNTIVVKANLFHKSNIYQIRENSIDRIEIIGIKRMVREQKLLMIGVN